FHGSHDLIRSTGSRKKELLNPEHFPKNVFIKSEMKRKMKELGHKEEKEGRSTQAESYSYLDVC
ncbi:unnamed protein product, partial [Gulo gulo]